VLWHSQGDCKTGASLDTGYHIGRGKLDVSLVVLPSNNVPVVFYYIYSVVTG